MIVFLIKRLNFLTKPTLSAPRANSLNMGAENTVPYFVSARYHQRTHTNVMSQTIIYPNPNPNQKNLKFGPRIPNPNPIISASRRGRLTVCT